MFPITVQRRTLFSRIDINAVTQSNNPCFKTRTSDSLKGKSNASNFQPSNWYGNDLFKFKITHKRLSSEKKQPTENNCRFISFNDKDSRAMSVGQKKYRMRTYKGDELQRTRYFKGTAELQNEPSVNFRLNHQLQSPAKQIFQTTVPQRSIRPNTRTNWTSSGRKQSTTEVSVMEVPRQSQMIIGEELGKGSYAIVYVGTDKLTKTQFAVKVYKKEKMNTRTRRKIIEDEIAVLQLCRHKNVMRYYRRIETTTEIQLILELVKGKSLGALLRAQPNGALSEAQAKPLLSKILDAMAYLHSRNIYHRDLKLDNVLVSDSMEPTIIDFGFSCVALPNQSLCLFCGTPNYMSPEIVAKREYLGGPNDAWAFGVLFFRILVGSFPFASRTTQELNKRIVKADFQLPKSLSCEAKRVVESLLIVEQSQRSSLEKLRSFRFFL